MKFPLPRNLEVEYGFVTGNNNLVPEAIREDLHSKFSWGGIPLDPPSRHTCLHTLLSSCYISPPPQLKILYEILVSYWGGEPEQMAKLIVKCPHVHRRPHTVKMQLLV